MRNTQHTFVESEEARYCYQPIDSLFLVIITNKLSNLIQDMEALQLMGRLISEYCYEISEAEIRKKAFELMYAFDEAVTLGYKEPVSLSQVKTFMAMESHDELLQEMISKNKEREAKEAAKLKMKQIELQKREMKRLSVDSPISAKPTKYSQEFSPTIHENISNSAASASTPSLPSGRGMRLSKKEPAIQIEATSYQPPAVKPTSPLQAKPQVMEESVVIMMEEKLSLSCNRDGGINNMEIKGDLSLKVNDPSFSKMFLCLDGGVDQRLVQFKTHPNVDKALFSELKIGLKDASRGFPINQPLGVLKWRFSSKDEKYMPISVNCWPSPNANGQFDVNIEYQLENTLISIRNLIISIPIMDQPVIGSISGEYYFDRSSRCLQWSVPVVDVDHPSGSLEFTVAASDANDLFPIHLSFVTNKSLCGVTVISSCNL